MRAVYHRPDRICFWRLQPLSASWGLSQLLVAVSGFCCLRLAFPSLCLCCFLPLMGRGLAEIWRLGLVGDRMYYFC